MNFANIALISKDIKVLIIGGGKASLIKTKAFIKRGCKVSVCSLNFLDELYKIKNENLKLIQGSYEKSMIEDKHFVVIAIDDDKVINEIITECNNKAKLYLNCKDFKNGNCIVPFQVESSTVNVAINTKEGNPKVSRMLSPIILSILEEKNDLIILINKVRQDLKGHPKKGEILDYLVSKEFQEEFRDGNGKERLKEVYEKLGLKMEEQ